MKKVSTVLMILCAIGFMAGPAFAQSYCQDVLETGNPGGRTTGLKTCDTVNPETLNPGDTFSIDVWVADIPESIISSGFEIFYNPAQVSLVSVLAYDGVDIAGGPWDGTATLKIPEAYGPGSYVLAVVQLGTCPVPDAGGDIIIAQVTFQCLANGTGDISVKGIDGFDTTVGCTSSIVYDATMGTNVLTVTQGTPGCTSNAQCDDGLYCNGAETCNTGTGECQPGTPVNCDDGIPCTTDSCNEGTDSCDHAPNDAACNDGQYCTGVEVCNPSSGCVAGTPVVCDDGIACTTDSCNEATDSCDYIPDNAACSDGLYCNGNEICNPSSGCEAGTPVSCPDDGLFCNGTESCDEATDSCVSSGDPCTPPEVCNEDTDSCAVLGCTTNAECDDGLYCTGVETCDTGSGNCVAGTPVDCNDGIACTTDSCNETTDSCDNIPNNAACDDGLYCNGNEICNPSSGCQAGTPVSCPDDGLFCNGTESCDEATDSCVSSGDPCTPPEVCNEDTDSCAVLGCTTNAECDDGLYCNGVETCDTGSGICQLGTPVDCNDGIACTSDSCNEATDSCDNIPDNAACDDGTYCNGMEICDPVSGCQAGTPRDCSDAVDCTEDLCNEDLDICEHIPTDANCPDDGLFCNGTEYCDPINGCVSTGDPCPSGYACNEDTDSCDPVSGITVSVDIDPYACPNHLNLESTGKVRVTILGTSSFDVMSIDKATVMLSREGTDGAVAPRLFDDGYMDRETPDNGELCACADCVVNKTEYTASSGEPDSCGRDGYADLSAYFKISQLVEVLNLNEVAGQIIPLTLTAKLMDGTDISGKDCVLVQASCKGDFDCDGDVDGKDTQKIKTKFGWRSSVSPDGDAETLSGDFDDDGDIDAVDINSFLGVFGSMFQGNCAYLECKGDFDCDRDVDGTDSKGFKDNYGRNSFYNPCDDVNPCNGDFDDDLDCDGTDAAGFKADFGRGLFQNPCRGCVE